jgi:hypothetical protein
LGGGKMGSLKNLPALPEGEQEPYVIRPAVEADLPWLLYMYQRDTSRSLVAVVRDETLMRDDLLGKSPKNINRFAMCVIETPTGQPVGYLCHPWFSWGDMQSATQYELDEGVSFRAVTPSVIRYLWKIGQVNAPLNGKTLTSYGFWLGSDHPLYHVSADWLVQESRPYAYYVRVPDLPAFVTRIAAALEQRLAQSPMAGHTGELKLSFYRDGLRLAFENGRLVTSEAWKPRIRDDEGHAAFPSLTFLQLLFCYHSLADLREAYPDVWWSDGDSRALLEVLFPKLRSDSWAIS